MVGHDLAALNTKTRTAMSEINSQSQERKTKFTVQEQQTTNRPESV